MTGRDAPSDMLSTDTDTEDDEDILFEANNAKNNKRGRKPRGEGNRKNNRLSLDFTSVSDPYHFDADPLPG